MFILLLLQSQGDHFGSCCYQWQLLLCWTETYTEIVLEIFAYHTVNCPANSDLRHQLHIYILYVSLILLS